MENLRDARGLKTGDVIKLYWNDNKFIFTTNSIDESGSDGADQAKQGKVKKIDKQGKLKQIAGTSASQANKVG